VAALRGRDLVLIATSVATPDDLALCRRLGFAAFLLRLGLRLGFRFGLRLGPGGFTLGQLLLAGPERLFVLGHGARFGLGLELLDAGHVAALTHTSAATDPLAQVVELGPAYVAASDHLDLLDLRRVDREGAFHADPERLLSNGEALAHPAALPLDHDALEDLRTAPLAFDHLEVHPHAVAGGESGNPAHLCALQAVNQTGHGSRHKEGARPRARRASAANGSGGSQRLRRARSRLFSRRQSRIRAWLPESSTSGTACPRHSAGRV
jgi:hypothetical protein